MKESNTGCDLFRVVSVSGILVFCSRCQNHSTSVPCGSTMPINTVSHTEMFGQPLYISPQINLGSLTSCRSQPAYMTLYIMYNMCQCHYTNNIVLHYTHTVLPIQMLSKQNSLWDEHAK